MQYEFRWYKSVDDGDFKLQFRQVSSDGDIATNWITVPFVLEGFGVVDK
jgi:hypothetical protein